MYLRELEFDDWERVHSYASQKRVCTYQPWGPNSEDESKGYVEIALKDAKRVPRTRFVFGAIRKSDDQLIGAGELNIRDASNSEGEIGYIVHPEVWGKGVATEMAALLLRYGFKTHHLHRIVATCHPHNLASARVLEKNRMSYEGRLREHMLMRGEWRDSLLYSLLEHEWRQ